MSRKQQSSVFLGGVNDCMAGMKSETQDALESGAKNRTVRPALFKKKIVNFRSFRMEQTSADRTVVPRFRIPDISVYTMDYSRRSRSSEKRQSIPEVLPDPDFCRRPINPFYSMSSCQFKFMDDHHSSNLETEYRKKLNFFRQLRNQSQLF